MYRNCSSAQILDPYVFFPRTRRRSAHCFINKIGEKHTSGRENSSHPKTHPVTCFQNTQKKKLRERQLQEKEKTEQATRNCRTKKSHNRIKRPDQKLLEIPMLHHSLYRHYHIQYFKPFRTNSCILHALLVHLVIQEKVRTFSSLPTF